MLLAKWRLMVSALPSGESVHLSFIVKSLSPNLPLVSRVRASTSHLTMLFISEPWKPALVHSLPLVVSRSPISLAILTATVSIGSKWVTFWVMLEGAGHWPKLLLPALSFQDETRLNSSHLGISYAVFC